MSSPGAKRRQVVVSTACIIDKFNIKINGFFELTLRLLRQGLPASFVFPTDGGTAGAKLNRRVRVPGRRYRWRENPLKSTAICLTNAGFSW
jgi:hypothetical protein